MTEQGEPLFVRPEPSDRDKKTMANRKETGRRYPAEASTEWWERGGLLVDDQGPAVVDADGYQRRFPPWVRGWVILCQPPVGYNLPNFAKRFALATPTPQTYRIVLDLPSEYKAGLFSGHYEHFAEVAGFYFVYQGNGVRSRPVPRGQGASWWDAVNTLDDRRNVASAKVARRLGYPVTGSKGTPAWKVPYGWPPAPIVE